MITLGLQQNPRLGQASAAIEAARGRAIQAGLYPNPNVAVVFDELGDKTGAKGVNTLPLVTQEIVVGGKLRLSREAGFREMDQACWERVGQRYAMFAAIRVAYFDALTLQERVEILEEVLTLAERSVDQTSKLLKAQQVARLDLVQLEVEQERLRADREAAERELPAAYKRLAAATGVSELNIRRVAGSLEVPLPEYDLQKTQDYVLGTHPDVKAAKFGVERARILVQRAKVEPVPNVTVDTGHVRQNQNNSDDYRIGASLTVPLWNRNQGTIRSSEADLRSAMKNIRRVENELTDRVATAMRDYAAARTRAERYRNSILPKANETYDLSFKAYQGGQFEYLRVLEAQRAVAQANLEYNRALGDAWKAAAAISGLVLEDCWPEVPALRDEGEGTQPRREDDSEPLLTPPAPPPPSAMNSRSSTRVARSVAHFEDRFPRNGSDPGSESGESVRAGRTRFSQSSSSDEAGRVRADEPEPERYRGGMRIFPFPRKSSREE